MVSIFATVVNRSTNHSTLTGQSSPPTSQSGTTSSKEKTGFGHLDAIRKALSDKGHSKESIDIICASWTTGTEKQYKEVQNMWIGWCHHKQKDLFQASADQVANFLTDCYHEGRGYSTINTYSSALSTTLNSVNDDKQSIGSHPLIVRLLNGIHLLRQPTPRYSSTWDVSKVTDYLKTLAPLNKLSLKSLTLKTVMLCALASAQREHTSCALDLNCMKDSGNSISFL